jgi:UDP-N-acetylmuramoylalanine--D-glutamate ligase
MDWMKTRVLIIGAARQGLALTRYLSGRGAQVILNDRRSAAELAAARESLAGLPVEWVCGSHPLELLDRADLVCLSGGVPLTMPLVAEAARRGLPISNDTEIFLGAVKCPVIGITGSAGKTTTTTLVGRMAQAGVQAPRRAWVGGNIGLPLVEYLDEIQPDDLVILELSSFQLEQVTHSPHIAAVLNITPNHLDRHGTMEAYTAAKARILDFQHAGDIAVLNREDGGSWGLARNLHGSLVSFGLQRPNEEFTGTYAENGQLFWQSGKEPVQFLDQEEIQLRGQHNVVSVLAAAALAFSAGLSREAVRAGVLDFQGVTHRLELVREWRGIRWYNDSIATAPERTIAGVHAFNEPLVLLLGGRDKKLPWDTLAEVVHQRVDHVILFGEAAEMIEKVFGAPAASGRPYTQTRCATLEEAVAAAARVAQSGDVVLLSPGGTSFDEFADFEERGEAYRTWVNKLA